MFVETGRYIPVQRGNQRIEREWSWVASILAPDGACVRMITIMWDAICIVDADDDIQQPGHNRTDLVGPNSLGIMTVAEGEWVG
jgi:hypothetical protein